MWQWHTFICVLTTLCLLARDLGPYFMLFIRIPSTKVYNGSQWSSLFVHSIFTSSTKWWVPITLCSKHRDLGLSFSLSSLLQTLPYRPGRDTLEGKTRDIWNFEISNTMAPHNYIQEDPLYPRELAHIPTRWFSHLVTIPTRSRDYIYPWVSWLPISRSKAE